MAGGGMYQVRGPAFTDAFNEAFKTGVEKSIERADARREEEAEMAGREALTDALNPQPTSQTVRLGNPSEPEAPPREIEVDWVDLDAAEQNLFEQYRQGNIDDDQLKQGRYSLLRQRQTGAVNTAKRALVFHQQGDYEAAARQMTDGYHYLPNGRQAIFYAQEEPNTGEVVYAMLPVPTEAEAESGKIPPAQIITPQQIGIFLEAAQNPATWDGYATIDPVEAAEIDTERARQGYYGAQTSYTQTRADVARQRLPAQIGADEARAEASQASAASTRQQMAMRARQMDTEIEDRLREARERGSEREADAYERRMERWKAKRDAAGLNKMWNAEERAAWLEQNPMPPLPASLGGGGGGAPASSAAPRPIGQVEINGVTYPAVEVNGQRGIMTSAGFVPRNF